MRSALDVRGDTLALRVEQADPSKSGLLQDIGVDEFHLFQNGEELLLNVESGQRLVWQGLQPLPYTFQQVVVDDRLSKGRSAIAQSN